MKKDFDFFKFASKKDEKRYMLSGVFHQNGFKYATNSKILVKIQSSYESKFENKIIDKDFCEIDSQYPNCERVIPAIEDLKESFFDFCELKKILKEKAFFFKSYKAISNGKILVKFPNGAVVNFEFVKLMLYFLDFYPNAKLYLNEDPEKALRLFDSDNNATLVIMPMLNTVIDYSEQYFKNVYFDSLKSIFDDTDDFLIRAILAKTKKNDILKRMDNNSLIEKDFDTLKECENFISFLKEFHFGIKAENTEIVVVDNEIEYTTIKQCENDFDENSKNLLPCKKILELPPPKEQQAKVSKREPQKSKSKKCKTVNFSINLQIVEIRVSFKIRKPKTKKLSVFNKMKVLLNFSNILNKPKNIRKVGI